MTTTMTHEEAMARAKEVMLDSRIKGLSKRQVSAWEQHNELVDRVALLEDRVSNAIDEGTSGADVTDERLTRLEEAMVMMARAVELKAEADFHTLELIEDLNKRLIELEETPVPVVPAPSRHVVDAAIALADAVEAYKRSAWGEETQKAYTAMDRALSAFRAALAETEREPVQQDCGCEELWRLAQAVADRDQSWGSHASALINLCHYVREHGNG